MMKSRYILLVLLMPGVIAGCAAPGPDGLISQTPAISPVSQPSLNTVDEILIETFGPLIPPVEEWSPREELSPAPTGTFPILQTIPLSSLAYFPRLLPRLQLSLEAAGLFEFEIARHSSPGGEVWEMTIESDESVIYRVELVQAVAGRVAVIIDDCGNSLRNRDLFLNIDYPLTLAVLPRLPYSAAVDRLASENEFEVILHCPLEAINPDLVLGPGAIYCDTPAEEAARILDENIRELPHVVGVNNHMGSSFTTDTAAMRILLEEIKRKGLFFIDSLTVPGTVTSVVAEEVGVEYLSRDIFLDHENNEEFITQQFEALKKKAIEGGFAIAIGHDRTLTLKILGREIPTLADDNLQLVPVSDLF